MRMHAEAVEWAVPHSLRGSVASVVGYRSPGFTTRQRPWTWADTKREFSSA